MKRIFPVLVVGMLASWTAAAQNSVSTQGGASAQSQTSVQTNNSGARAAANGSGSAMASTSAPANEGKKSADISDGTKIDSALTSSLDAKKNKPGDRVEARTTQDVKQDGKVVLKKGTRLVGHVTQTQARAGGQSQSQLGIVFDHAVLKNGDEVPFNATIQALAVAQSSTAAAAGADDMMASGSGMGAVSGPAQSGGGLLSGATSTTGAAAGSVVHTASTVPVNAGGTLNTATHSTGAVGGLSSEGNLTSNSVGVFGMHGLSIDSAVSNATQGSMIVSSTRNVHLDSGTQMLLSAGGKAQ
jgi:hypothetical protein